jgi:hypothetical protein
VSSAGSPAGASDLGLRAKTNAAAGVLIIVEQYGCRNPTMPDASFFREKAQRWRELSEIAIRPEVREQLGVWAEEFAALAESADQAPGPSAR